MFVVGTVAIGPNIVNDGAIVMSEASMVEVLGPWYADRPAFIGLRLVPGADLTATQEALNRALAQTRESDLIVSLHFNLGNLGMAAGRPEQAVREFGLAVQLDPRNAATRFNLAVALLRLGGRNADAVAQQLDHAQRIVNLVKPAHTAFDVKPYWTLLRIGQVRLGLDTVLGLGSRPAGVV